MNAVFSLRSGGPNGPKVRYEIPIPDGWRRVWRGTVLRGDRYLNLILYVHDDIVHWSDVDWDDLDLNREYGSGAAEFFTVLIRRGQPADLPCERCESNRRIVGERYCSDCRRAVLTQLRRDHFE